jgi:hypothetical protein
LWKIPWARRKKIVNNYILFKPLLDATQRGLQGLYGSRLNQYKMECRYKKRCEVYTPGGNTCIDLDFGVLRGYLEDFSESQLISSSTRLHQPDWDTMQEMISLIK